MSADDYLKSLVVKKANRFILKTKNKHSQEFQNGLMSGLIRYALLIRVHSDTLVQTNLHVKYKNLVQEQKGLP